MSACVEVLRYSLLFLVQSGGGLNRADREGCLSVEGIVRLEDDVL